MLIDEDSSKTEMLTASLNEAGFAVASRVSCYDEMINGIQQYEPDVLVIDMEEPDDPIFNHHACYGDNSHTGHHDRDIDFEDHKTQQNPCEGEKEL